MTDQNPSDKVFELVQGAAGKMKGKLKWIVLFVVLLIVLPLVRGVLFTWKVIDPGFTGIKINRLVNTY